MTETLESTSSTLEYRSPAPLHDESVVNPLRELLGLAIPTVLQMCSYTAMMFVDTWMLAHVSGASAAAAAGNAGGLTFSTLSFGVGTIMVVNTLASQAFGKKNFAHCGTYLWQGVWFGIAFWLLTLPLVWVMPHVFGSFHHPADVVAMETLYSRVLILSGVFKLVQTSFSQFMIGTNRPRAVVVSSTIGVSVNAIAAYAMLFGKLGMPAMGIRGSAYGLVVGSFIEMIVLIVLALWNKNDRAKFDTLAIKFRWNEMKTLAKVGFGSGMQFIVEVMAWSLFANWVFGGLGIIAMSANQFMFRYITVTFMPALGMSSAVTALVGRYIGMGKPDVAMQRAHLGFKVTLCYLVIAGTIYVIFRRSLIGLFTHDPEVLRLGAILMIFAAFYELVDGMYIIYYGALRGAGDTFIPACVTAVTCWTIMLFGGHLMTKFFPQMGVAGPWSIASVYGVILGFFMLIRFNRGKWKRIHLESGANDNKVALLA